MITVMSTDTSLETLTQHVSTLFRVVMDAGLPVEMSNAETRYD